MNRQEVIKQCYKEADEIAEEYRLSGKQVQLSEIRSMLLNLMIKEAEMNHLSLLFKNIQLNVNVDIDQKIDESHLIDIKRALWNIGD